MKRSEPHPSLDGTLRRLLWSMLLLVCVILVATLAILLLHNQQYSLVTANIVRASQFNQNFKEEVDLKMYYYVIDSSYGETLPLQEVDEAKALAQELLSGTQDRQSRKAITSAIDLCENLHERIVQITETDGYEARMELLESNIYILTELIQQYFYTYLYHEAGYLDSLQAALTARLWLELGLVAAGALVLVGVLMRRSAAISRSITQPIYALRERAQSIGRGDLAAREPVVAEDETLQALSSSIEQMAQHLQQQMALNRQEQAKLRAMELALLQSQINPHFLYNTLDTIIWLVETGKNEQAVEMVTSLSNFFRSSLSKGRDIITLGEEEIHVRSYLEIQQVRYRDILCYEIHVQPEHQAAPRSGPYPCRRRAGGRERPDLRARRRRRHDARTLTAASAESGRGRADRLRPADSLPAAAAAVRGAVLHGTGKRAGRRDDGHTALSHQKGGGGMRRLTLLFLSFMLLLSGCMPYVRQPPEAETTRITVGFSQVGAESDWRVANTESMRESLSEENGFELLFDNARQKQENQFKAIRTFIQQDVDYIVLAPVTETGWESVLEEARTAGIPVIIVDRQIETDDDSLYTSWVGSDFRRTADEAVSWLAETLEARESEDAEVQILHLQGTPGSTAQLQRSAALEAGAASHEGWVITAQLNGDFTQAKAYEETLAYLQSNPAPDVVYCENDNMCFGVMQALDELGIAYGTGGVTLISFDAVRRALSYCKDGKIDLCAECNPLHGPRVRALIEQLERGETPEKQSYVPEQLFTADRITDELLESRVY